jgi:vitamin B12 transporter
VTFVAANIDRAIVRGGELSARMRFNQGWQLATTYTHLQTRDEGTGLPLYRRPRNAGSATLTYVRDHWTVSVTANAVGPRFERDFETFSNRYNAGFVVCNTAGSFLIRSALQLTARIDNLFDRRYAEVLAFPMPRRTVHAGVRLGF